MPSYGIRKTRTFGRLLRFLPAYRAEQGFASRPRRSDSIGEDMYDDLGIDPNEITEWNEAGSVCDGSSSNSGDDHLGRQHDGASTAEEDHTHTHTHAIGVNQWNEPRNRWNGKCVNQGRLGLHDHQRHRSAQSTNAEQKQAIVGPDMTLEELTKTLKAKEAVRHQRRHLQASRDYLGVTGADPWTGDIHVLTPTVSVSSDAISETVQDHLQTLRDERELAEAVYHDAARQEKDAVNQVEVAKARRKLEKIQVLKGQRSLNPSFSRKKRAKGRYSSAAEPNLTPITQSPGTMTPLSGMF